MKFAKYILILICFTFLTGCSFERGIILYNKEPINKYNITNDQKIFEEGSRIYYIFIAPKKMKCEFIRIQIFKMTDKAPWGGNEVVRTRDVRVMKDERYYNTDYFVIREKGRYVMQVFSHDDLKNPLALNDFYVK